MDEGSQEVGRAAPMQLGRYQLLKKIAVGGMAEIYLARVSGVGGFEKNVVLKRILPQLAESDELFGMFLDEARIAATLQHPNVIQVYDAGYENGEYFIAMEYLEGGDLLTVQRTLSRSSRTIPLEHALHIALGVAAGLHYAHEKVGLDDQPLHIVHRDVTPHNIFLTGDGGVKLVDFGIAKATNRISQTSYGTLKGKLAYMSPEQCQGEAVDRRTDIYSLGIVLYEMTTGARLYQGQGEYVVLKEIVEGEIAPPSSVKPGFPRELEEIIMRALEKVPDRRFQTARDLQRALTEFGHRQQLSITALAMAEWLEPVLEEARERARRRRKWRDTAEQPGRATRPEGGEAERGYVSQGLGEDLEDLGSGMDELLAELGVGRDEGAEEQRTSSKPKELRQEDRWEATPPPEHGAIAARVAGDLAKDGQTATEEMLHPPHFGEDLRQGGTLKWLAACLLVIGAGAAVWFSAIAPRQAEQATGGEPEAAPAGPKTGRAVIESDPAGASVWMDLGRAPVQSPPVASGRAHLLLVEHDGYRSERIEVSPESFRGQGDEQRAEVRAVLEPETAEDAGAEASGGGDGGRPASGAESAGGRGRIRVAADPSAARVWLKVGETPATLERLPADRSYEFRLEHEGYAPAFAKIDRDELAAGRAHVRTGMQPRSP